MIKAYGAVSDEQMALLTDELLFDPSARAIIGRVGIHGDFSEVEEEYLDTFIRRSSDNQHLGFGKELTPGDFEYKGVHPFNLNLVIVLARRIVDKRFENSRSKDSIDFLRANYMPMPPRYGPSPKFHAADVIHFAKEIDSKLEIASLVERTTRENVWTEKDDEMYGAFERAYLKKYGLQSKSFPGTALRLCRMKVRGEVSSFDDHLTQEYLRRHINNSSIACCVFEGVKNV